MCPLFLRVGDSVGDGAGRVHLPHGLEEDQAEHAGPTQGRKRG